MSRDFRHTTGVLLLLSTLAVAPTPAMSGGVLTAKPPKPQPTSPCADRWPAPVVVSSLEELIQRRLVSSSFDLLDFDGQGEIVIFDFESRKEQNATFDRISTFVESASYRDRVVTGQGMTDYDGHNLSTALLARYFRAAIESRSALTPQEERLRRGLLCRGLLLSVGGELVGRPRTAILAVNHDVSLASSRAAIVSHELSHGFDMTREDHWRWTRERWAALEDEERLAWQELIMGQRDYDPRDEALLIAEFGAYSAMFGLESILELRGARGLSGLDKREMARIRSGRRFAGLLPALELRDPSAVLQFEYRFKRTAERDGVMLLVTRAGSDKAVASRRGVAGSVSALILFPTWKLLQKSIGRLTLRRVTGRQYSVLEVDGDRLVELLEDSLQSPGDLSRLGLAPKPIDIAETSHQIDSMGRNLPAERTLLDLLETVRARSPDSGPQLGLISDCPVCEKSVRLTWLLYQVEFLSGGAAADAAEMPGSRDFESISRQLGLGLSVDSQSRAVRAALVAVSRSGVDSSSDFSALPPGVGILLRWAIARQGTSR